MLKYCRFLKDVYDNEQLIFKKNVEYLVKYEDDFTYVFKEYDGLQLGIDKQFKNDLYKVFVEE